MDKINIEITDKFSLLTIKEFLKENNVGRGKIEYIRVNKLSLVNDVFMPLETKLQKGDKLSFIIDENIDFVAENKDIDVVYEDEYVLIVNKPINMIIHPDDKSKTGTLVNLVANYYKKKNINRQVRYIHRIDKDTSGLVLFAKDFLSEAILLKDLQNNLISRYYLALVEGKLERKSGTINAPIGKDRHINNKMCVSSTGKEAISKYELVNQFNNYCLVKFKLLTGRTHQIRVHASYINHPLLGDVVYGGNYQYIKRIALHSHQIDFIHPITKKELSIKLDIPNDMKI